MSESDRQRGWFFWLMVIAALAGVVAAGVAVVDLLIGTNLTGRGSTPSVSVQPPTSGPSQPSTNANGPILSDNEVKVVWTGDGEALEVSWEPMTYNNLKGYWVDIYGLHPVDSRTPVGIGPVEELDTFKVIRPVADTKDYYNNFPGEEDPKVGPGETWRICVTGESEPGPDGENRTIEGSRICSTNFKVPS